MDQQRAPKGTVTLALLSGDGPESHTARTINDIIHFDGRLGNQHLHLNRPQLWVVGALVTNARNRLVQQFLKQPPDNQAEWLLFLDDDQLYPETLLEILMASAHPVERRIVGLPVWRFISKDDGPVRVTHNVFDIDENGELVEWPDPFPENAVMQVAAVGSGCMLIHRTALEEIQREAIKNELPPDWCWFLQWPFKPEGEDIWFCRMAARCQIPVWINTSTTLQHMKTIALQGPAPEGTYSIGGETFDQPEPTPPASDRVAVIVPVLNRPQNAAPFMSSLFATTRLATVYAVCSEETDAVAWSKAGAKVVRTDRVSFPCKVNDAYAETSEPWVFLCGDDVKFHAGWLDEAQHAARQTGAQMVGTNDLGNARVIAGDHATHMLIARSYIDDTGASWDGPGVVTHEGYRHWCVDDELVTAAKQRGVWTSARKSIVEHFHPYWGKSEADDTYRLGEERAAEDMALFNTRKATNAEVAA